MTFIRDVKIEVSMFEPYIFILLFFLGDKFTLKPYRIMNGHL